MPSKALFADRAAGAVHDDIHEFPLLAAHQAEAMKVWRCAQGSALGTDPGGDALDEVVTAFPPSSAGE